MLKDKLLRILENEKLFKNNYDKLTISATETESCNKG
jgi:hypothetical protein